MSRSFAIWSGVCLFVLALSSVEIPVVSGGKLHNFYQQLYGFNESTDCEYGDWQKWQSCHLDEKGRFMKKRTRTATPPRNGGKPCDPEVALLEYRPCTDYFTMADRFLRSIYQTRPAPNPGDDSPAVGKNVRIQVETLAQNSKACRKYVNENDSLLMGGGQCLGGYQYTNGMKTPLDLLFLLDETVGASNFANGVALLAAGITRNLCGYRYYDTKVACASYDSEVRMRFPFKKMPTDGGAAIVGKIKRLKYSPQNGSTPCLGSALLSSAELFSTSPSARQEGAVERMIIVITSGCSTCDNTTLEKVAEELRNKVSFMTVLVGGSEECKDTMLELGNQDRCWNLIAPPTWEYAATLAKTFLRQGCERSVWYGGVRGCYT